VCRSEIDKVQPSPTPMPISVVMPALEMAQETGKLVCWRKNEGDHVSKGEPLLEIETDKAVMEIESPGDGVLGGVKQQAGAEVPVGQTIAWILQPGEAVPVEETAGQSARQMRATTAPTPSPAIELTGQDSKQSIKISPKARRLAKERGIDLAQVRGSGPEGEILAADIQTAASTASAPEPNTASTSQPALSQVARLMAERTAKSWSTVPHFYVVGEVDARALSDYRAQIAASPQRNKTTRITHTDLFIALVARVLARHPRLNASWIEHEIRENPSVNISLAIAVDEGVVAPVISKANELDLEQIASQREDLGSRARAGKLRPADLAGGTFTISNLGMFHVDAFSAIIIEPQAAILAIGTIVDRVVPADGKVAIRPMVTLTLSADHRVVDGARAAKFMDALAAAIRNPAEWLKP
jgi:pyruvate dehydrogenase E2 component (dihydrolipoamide acetyltransferase)